MKYAADYKVNIETKCRSREGAWIEITLSAEIDCEGISRSREGAWIEICIYSTRRDIIPVAPARERGLKYLRNLVRTAHVSRSREGAWIEISLSWL